MIYEEIETCYRILPEFGKQRLLLYAESLEELSSYYVSLLEQGESISREEKVCDEKLGENRKVISGQLKEISRMLKGLANEAYYTTKSLEKYKKKICIILKENGLEIKELYAIENGNGYLEIGMILNACKEGDVFETEDIGEFLSKLLHNHMSVVPGMPLYIGDEEVKVVFREEVRFFMNMGVARATKEGEISSGDNFTQEQWDAISVGESNLPLASAALQLHDYENGICTICQHCNYIAGDINGDNVVDQKDAIYLLLYSWYGEEFYPMEYAPGDVNSDGAVEQKDAIYLLLHSWYGEEFYPLYPAPVPAPNPGEEEKPKPDNTGTPIT